MLCMNAVACAIWLNLGEPPVQHCTVEHAMRRRVAWQSLPNPGSCTHLLTCLLHSMPMQPACATPAWEGLEVQTANEAVQVRRPRLLRVALLGT